MSARYSVFFCPDDVSALGKYGQQVLGRSADGRPCISAFQGCPDLKQAQVLAATPAHYGFHATLKAPFQLHEQTTESQLLGAVEALAQRQHALTMQTLRPRQLAGFMALTLRVQSDAVVALAEHCVTQLEHFRAPLTQADIIKRKPEQLTSRQLEYLHRYGYPHVLSEFRFHMTLTGSILSGQHDDHIRWLAQLFDEQVRQTPVLDRLAVFWQPDRATPFVRLAQYVFSG